MFLTCSQSYLNLLNLLCMSYLNECAKVHGLCLAWLHMHMETSHVRLSITTSSVYMFFLWYSDNHFCIMKRFIKANVMIFKFRSSLLCLPLISWIYRDELGQKASVSGNAKAGHNDIDGSLFRNGTKADGTKTQPWYLLRIQRCCVICKWLFSCFQTQIQTVSCPWTNTAAHTHPLIHLIVKTKTLKWNQNGIMRDSHYTALQKVQNTVSFLIKFRLNMKVTNWTY